MTLLEWLQAATASGAIGAMGLAGATYLKTRPAMKQAQVKGEDALWAQINELKDDAKQERERCDDRISRLEERHALAIGELRKEMSGEVQILRHDRNNTRQVLVFLLSRIKKIDHPELRELAAEADEMLARGEAQVALERGAMKGMRP